MIYKNYLFIFITLLSVNIYSSNLNSINLSTIDVVPLIIVIPNNKQDITLNSQKNLDTQQNKKNITQRLTYFDAKIIGEVINSKQFKVIKNAQIEKLWNGDTKKISQFIQNSKQQQFIVDKNNSNNNIILESNENNNHKLESSGKTNQIFKQESNDATYLNNTNLSSTVLLQNTTPLPDYLLLGQITDIVTNYAVENLQDTDKAMQIFTLSVVINYQLLRTSDGTIMSAFSVYSSSKNNRIIKQSDSDKQNFSTIKQQIDMPYLINELAKSVAISTAVQLLEQFKLTINLYNYESPVITNLKIFN